MTLPFLSLVAVLLTAPAAPNTAKVSRLDQGQKLFVAGDVDGALKLLEQAVPESTDAASLERVHLLRAQCFAAKQDFTRAEDAFALALDANPLTALDPARVDPTVVKLLDAVRARLSGTVVIASHPDGANVSLDGKALGAAPQTSTTSIGPHKVELTWSNGSVAFDVLVRPKREVRIEGALATVAPALTAPVKADGPKERPLRPFGEVRGLLELPSVQAPPRGGLDVGGGIELSWFRIGLTARVFPYFGLAPRFAFVVPVLERLSVFIEAHVPVWFRGGGVAIGVGGSVGADFAFLPWLQAFAAVGGQHLFLNPGYNDDTHFTGTLGIRLRVP